MTHESLIGLWQLISHGTYDSNNIFSPTSQELAGQLIYGSDFSLSVLILFKSEPTAARDVLAYSGRWDLLNEIELNHHIEICNRTERVGNVERRQFEISGQRLFLRAKLDNQRIFEAQWNSLNQRTLKK
jgi:5-methylcytosine-specific restriction endonuclease McrBC regulatory subunit McrC